MKLSLNFLGLKFSSSNIPAFMLLVILPIFGLLWYGMLIVVTYLFNYVIHIFRTDITLTNLQMFVILIVLGIIGNFFKSDK